MEQRASHSLYNDLLNKMSLRHLDLSVYYWDSPAAHWGRLAGYWNSSHGPQDCPATKFVTDLLEQKLFQLETLRFDSFPSKFLEYLGQDWTPWLPKLKVLDVARLKPIDHQVRFLHKIIVGSPKLAKLKGHFDPKMLVILPEEKYRLLGDFRLYIRSDQDKDLCWKLAQAKPALSVLTLDASKELQRQFEPSFFHVTEQLLCSSWKTLTELHMTFEIFALGQLIFPALINLENLNMNGTATAQQFLDAVNSIDYSKQLPMVKQVIIASTLYVYDDNDLALNPIVNLEIPDYTHQAATTVRWRR